MDIKKEPKFEDGLKQEIDDAPAACPPETTSIASASVKEEPTFEEVWRPETHQAQTPGQREANTPKEGNNTAACVAATESKEAVPMVLFKNGLRVRRLKPSIEKPAPKTNAQRCKEYRAKLQDDPMQLAEYCLKYQRTNRKNRQKTVTEEQLRRRRELSRLRQQKYRDKRRAARPLRTIEPTSSEATPTVTKRRHQHQKKAVIDARRERREKWRKYKQDERQKWSSQKRHQNRTSLGLVS